MHRLRLAALLSLALLAAPAATEGAVAPPHGLRTFLLRADEPLRTRYDRTPSLAWRPVAGARWYDVELATSRRFDSGTILWSRGHVPAPATEIPVALPWTNGDPAMLYARVRARTRAGLGDWSPPVGFDLEPAAPPQPLPAADGLVRWTPVPGATAYNVWFPDARKVFTTTTNVADEREFTAFHRDVSWSGRVRWRVRAVRVVYGRPANGLPAVSYGAWSDTYVAVNGRPSGGRLRLGSVMSDVVSVRGGARAHSLTPGFVFSGDQGLDGRAHDLFRAYVFTDRQCVNLVYRGAVVGGPAYAPRATGPLDLPKDATALADAAGRYLADGEEGPGYMADYLKVTANESVRPVAPGAEPAPAAGAAASTGAAAGAGTSVDASQTVDGSLVDLWDSGWPTGRYTWTVVPVDAVANADGQVEYRDAELPQDVCRAGRAGSFGKSSVPALTAAARPYASGLSPQGTLLAATRLRPAFYGAPLVAWEPAPGAHAYDVQVSPTRYPWRPVQRVSTLGTAALLENLAPGTWWYRVRGVDPYLPGPAKQMAWSQPVSLTVARPTFRVVGQGRAQRAARAAAS